MDSISPAAFDFRHHFSETNSFLIQAEMADFAFQPIISTSTLCVHGFEALARFPEGAPNACQLLDLVAGHGMVGDVDMMLVRNAIEKFSRFEQAGSTRLFCNLDNRSYGDAMPGRERIHSFLSRHGLTPANLSLEISERGAPGSPSEFLAIVEMLAAMGMKIALDDFGVGASSLHRLLMTQPDYVKIDRAFIDGIGDDMRKQAIVSKLCGLAHALGFMTVAEGVETERDFRTARDLGCDLAQGYYIARPTSRPAELSMRYEPVAAASTRGGQQSRITELMTPIAPIRPGDPLAHAVDLFKATPELRVVPVIDDRDMVMGAILEEDIRRYLLSDFGPSLLHNKGVAPLAGSLLRRFPVGKANGTVEALLDSYVASESSRGLILVHDGQYAGYISNHALLRLATENDLSKAREQNPLTQLPGNRAIADHVEALLRTLGPRTLVFFDFDNFKAFNDSYGFSAGDRALMIFADLLRGLESTDGAFIAHIGGDDFFASLPHDEARSIDAIRGLCDKFAQDAESLYSATDRKAGGIIGTDRFGTERLFPLLRASASVLHLPERRGHLSAEMVHERLTKGKTRAKASPRGMATVRLPEAG